ncbi:MAG: hypothetical protein AB8F95_08320 [Bacteroidia bacterium]
MKKILPILFVLTIVACSKKQNIGTIDSFSVQQLTAELIFEYSATGDFEFYEIAYDLSGNATDPDFAQNFTTAESDNVTKAISDLNIGTSEVYSFWIRGVDNENEQSEWLGPETITIADFCRDITSVEFSGAVFWSYDNSASEVSFYEVQYARQGFELGSGVTIQTNRTTTSDLILEKGTAYDVYVRAFCENNLGFSAWFGPVSHFAADNFNVCMPPTNIGYSTERNFFGDPVGADITWEDEGNNRKYEFNLVGNNQSPESSAYESRDDYGNQISYRSITPNVQYDFYIRTVCIDGTRMNWVGPLDVVIR